MEHAVLIEDVFVRTTVTPVLHRHCSSLSTLADMFMPSEVCRDLRNIPLKTGPKLRSYEIYPDVFQKMLAAQLKVDLYVLYFLFKLILLRDLLGKSIYLVSLHCLQWSFLGRA